MDQEAPERMILVDNLVLGHREDSLRARLCAFVGLGGVLLCSLGFGGAVEGKVVAGAVRPFSDSVFGLGWELEAVAREGVMDLAVGRFLGLLERGSFPKAQEVEAVCVSGVEEGGCRSIAGCCWSGCWGGGARSGGCCC
jgi:hypothetical protein